MWMPADASPRPEQMTAMRRCSTTVIPTPQTQAIPDAHRRDPMPPGSVTRTGEGAPHPACRPGAPAAEPLMGMCRARYTSALAPTPSSRSSSSSPTSSGNRMGWRRGMARSRGAGWAVGGVWTGVGVVVGDAGAVSATTPAGRAQDRSALPGPIRRDGPRRRPRGPTGASGHRRPRGGGGRGRPLARQDRRPPTLQGVQNIPTAVSYGHTASLQ